MGVGDDGRRAGSAVGLRSVLGRPADGDGGEPRDATDPERLSVDVPDE